MVDSVFISCDDSEMVDWLQSTSLMIYHLYRRLKVVTKTFLEKVKQKRLTC